MRNSFIALSNMGGIVCASDTDYTIFSLTEIEPVAIAVNTGSRIPWRKVIESYLSKGPISLHDSFGDYIQDLLTYLNESRQEIDVTKITESNNEVIFLGYGKQDFFPTSIGVSVGYDQTHREWIFTEGFATHINQKDTPSSICSFSEFKDIQAIFGYNEESRNRLSNIVSDYILAMKEAFMGTALSSKVEAILLEISSKPTDELLWLTSSKYNISTAVCYYNIEELVAIAEKFINYRGQIGHLRGRLSTECPSTKELAVITRVENLQYIKHHSIENRS